MSSFDLLHPAVQHHIVNSLGWQSLRPLQEQSIDHLLDGGNAILLAPTAGGKTEAAVFPLLSRMLTNNWQPVSIIYVCPLKALLNNLHDRLEQYCTLLGRTCGLWHGDVSTADRQAMLREPPDILLTTPESLEVMLVSSSVDHQYFLGQVRCAVIDEVHAFAGDDRGWHMLYLFERLQTITGREIQRIGLSATVGNPQELCDWLVGANQGIAKVINPPAEDTTVPEVQLDWVGSIENAAMVIARLHRGEKRLVFVDSRKRVEDLAYLLKGMEVETYVSHSSISLEERTRAEQAFSEGSNCVIVSTSTLELGIDVGDLDRVIQIDSPGSVASFLQRIGRTGRRRGTSRNCLFLATRADGFLNALGVLSQWSNGYVEPIKAPPAPWHIFAQQLMALTLQEKQLGVKSWRDQLPFTPGLNEEPHDKFTHTITHMLDTGILFSDAGVMGLGAAGEKNFGYRNFMELFSVFVSTPMYTVMHGKQVIGEVDVRTFAVKSDKIVLVLAGAAWRVKDINWSKCIAFVEPSDERGAAQWRSVGVPMSLELCQTILTELNTVQMPSFLSDRARIQLDTIREEYDWLETDETILLYDGSNQVTWWTFAGQLYNTAVANVLTDLGAKVQSSNLCIDWIGTVKPDAILNAINERILNKENPPMVPLDSEFIQELKFAECLKHSVVEVELQQRHNIDNEHGLIRLKPVRQLTVRS